MGQMELPCGLWGAKTVSRALWFYFPSPVDLRHTPLPSKTLRYGLQAELPGVYLKKMEIETESSCPACTCLPAQMAGGSLHPTQISGVANHYYLPITSSAHCYLQGHLACVWASQSLIWKLLHGTNLILKCTSDETGMVSIANISHNSALPLQ